MPTSVISCRCLRHHFGPRGENISSTSASTSSEIKTLQLHEKNHGPRFSSQSALASRDAVSTGSAKSRHPLSRRSRSGSDRLRTRGNLPSPSRPLAPFSRRLPAYQSLTCRGLLRLGRCEQGARSGAASPLHLVVSHSGAPSRRPDGLPLQEPLPLFKNVFVLLFFLGTM